MWSSKYLAKNIFIPSKVLIQIQEDSIQSKGACHKILSSDSGSQNPLGGDESWGHKLSCDLQMYSMLHSPYKIDHILLGCQQPFLHHFKWVFFFKSGLWKYSSENFKWIASMRHRDPYKELLLPKPHCPAKLSLSSIALEQEEIVSNMHVPVWFSKECLGVITSTMAAWSFRWALFSWQWKDYAAPVCLSQGAFKEMENLEFQVWLKRELSRRSAPSVFNHTAGDSEAVQVWEALD